MDDLIRLGSAEISPDRLYRYRLERHMGAGRCAAFIMINPSTADQDIDDATIRKLYGFASRNGIGRFIVGNKFALRSKDVADLRAAADPVGPDNDRHLEQIMRDADTHIVAWGPMSKLPRDLRGRWRDVVRIADKVGCPLQCLATAADGHPRHPLMLAYEFTPKAWVAP